MLLPMGRRVLYLFTEGAKKQHRLAHQLWLINFGAKTLPFGQNNHCHTFNLAVCVCVCVIRRECGDVVMNWLLGLIDALHN